MKFSFKYCTFSIRFSFYRHKFHFPKEFDKANEKLPRVEMIKVYGPLYKSLKLNLLCVRSTVFV